MTFVCKWGCGTWLHTDPSIISKNEKMIPLQENGLIHDCHLNPYYKFQNQGKQRAIAVKKQAIQKIDQYQIIEDLRNQIVNTNNRLSNYELELIVSEKTDHKPGS